MIRVRDSLKRLIRGVKDNMSAFLTAIGSALIPLAVVLVVEIPGASSLSSVWSWVALVLIIIGIAIIHRAWRETAREEQQRRKEGKVTLYVLASIAEKLGVDMDDAVKKVEKRVEDERDN